MSRDHNPTFLSDEDDTISDNNSSRGEMKGLLRKWTNLIHGWQYRYIVLKDGVLSYYKSEVDIPFGCRGSISVLKAYIQPNEFDECRFDVSLDDCVWHLRAKSSREKSKWVKALEKSKVKR